MRLFVFTCVLITSTQLVADDVDTSRGDKMIAEYFRQETELLSGNCLAEIESLDDWNNNRARYRTELLEMLGLHPLPEKSALHATVTRTHAEEDFTVENLHFQSRPGLYVTANLYRPTTVHEKLPAILYVCGHGGVKKDGVSFGNKVHYHHHGSWFARNGYICLTIDTLQLGEIEGIHHGTYTHDRWWWLNRGYTPAGVEAWNCVRAIDYLQSRSDVDGTRIGVTGRSGGGAYSWWVAAIDERIKCAVPVAGITDLTNHVVDGTVEGHCDCMFMVNTFRWDYAKVAALVAPRPLLISNTDTDRIFPLDGVYRTFEQVRRVYRMHGAADKVALHITAGGHKDTQELRVHAFRWFNHHLKQDDSLISKTADKFFEPEQLRVFESLPADEINTRIDETFVATPPKPTEPATAQDWISRRGKLIQQLRDKCFAGWPSDGADLALEPAFTSTSQGVTLRGFDFTSQSAVRLRLYLAHRANAEKLDLVVLNVLDRRSWDEFLATYRGAFPESFKDEGLPPADAAGFEQTRKMFQSFAWGMAYIAPRGVGPTKWSQTRKKQVQNRRRFHLLGQSWHGMQAYDVRRAIQALRAIDETSEIPLWLQSHRQMAGVTLYASLFEPKITRLDLYELPRSHRNGPYLLNVSRVTTMPQSVALAAEKSRVVIYDDDKEEWGYASKVAQKLEWDPKQLQIRSVPAGQ